MQIDDTEDGKTEQSIFWQNIAILITAKHSKPEDGKTLQSWLWQNIPILMMATHCNPEDGKTCWSWFRQNIMKEVGVGSRPSGLGSQGRRHGKGGKEAEACFATDGLSAGAEPAVSPFTKPSTSARILDVCFKWKTQKNTIFSSMKLDKWTRLKFLEEDYEARKQLMSSRFLVLDLDPLPGAWGTPRFTVGTRSARRCDSEFGQNCARKTSALSGIDKMDVIILSQSYLIWAPHAPLFLPTFLILHPSHTYSPTPFPFLPFLPFLHYVLP